MDKKDDFVHFQPKDGYVDAVNESGKTIMRFDQRENLVELDSETGSIKLNGYDLPRLNVVDIHLSRYDDIRMTIDLDIKPQKILLLMEGHVKWFEGVDRKKYLCGQKMEVRRDVETLKECVVHIICGIIGAFVGIAIARLIGL